jgi:predicted dehydrogenase
MAEESMAERFGIGVVGTGMGARPHAQALNALSDSVEVRGVYRRDAGKRRAFAAEHGLPEAETLEALLADPKVKALLVITPPNAREEIVAAAAKARKHVLLEKPIERTTAAAERIVAACDAAGLTLGLVFQHRFREGSLKLRELQDAGALGSIATVALNVPWWRAQADYYDQPGRGTLEQDGGGVLLTQAIHSLDLMLSFTGPVAQVAAIAGTSSLHRMETEDFVGAGLRFANGAIGSLSATTALYPGGAETLMIGFEKATATLSGPILTLAWHDGRRETFGAPAGAAGGGADPMAFPFRWHQAVIEDFVVAVQERRAPVSNGQTALRVHRLIDALLESSREGRAINVKS